MHNTAVMLLWQSHAAIRPIIGKQRHPQNRKYIMLQVAMPPEEQRPRVDRNLHADWIWWSSDV